MVRHVHNCRYFKLMGYARQLTGKFNGGLAGLIYVGYLTSQTVAIRRLCENDRKVISLRRVLEESKKINTAVAAKAGYLSQKLDSCQSVIDLVNNYIAHTANPQRRQNTRLRGRHDPRPRPSAEGLRRGDAGRAKRRHHGRFQTVGTS
jgi:hypothetical protein